MEIFDRSGISVCSLFFPTWCLVCLWIPFELIIIIKKRLLCSLWSLQEFSVPIMVPRERREFQGLDEKEGQERRVEGTGQSSPPPPPSSSSVLGGCQGGVTPVNLSGRGCRCADVNVCVFEHARQRPKWEERQSGSQRVRTAETKKEYETESEISVGSLLDPPARCLRKTRTARSRSRARSTSEYFPMDFLNVTTLSRSCGPLLLLLPSSGLCQVSCACCRPHYPSALYLDSCSVIMAVLTQSV